MELGTHHGEGAHPRGNPWRYLAPEALPGEGEGWLTMAAETGEAGVPWALQEPDKVFRYRHLSEHRVAHIQFRANFDVGQARIRDFIGDVDRRLDEDRPSHIILDNRQNGGGDLTRTADFVLSLADRLPPEGRVYSLTAHATFSAGIYTAFLSKAASPDRTVVVGSLVGDRTRFWAEGRALRLAGSGWSVGRSTQMHDLGAGCDDPSVCHIRKTEWNVAVGTFRPDVEIPTRSADVLAGRDAQVEWVLTVSR
jgi:hypothetical protein